MTVEKLDDFRTCFDPRNTLFIARSFLGSRHSSAEGFRTLHHYQDRFHGWNGRAYEIVDGGTIRAEIYEFLDGALRLDKDGNRVAFKPNRAKVTDVVDALQAEANLSAAYTPPTWLDGVGDVQAAPTDLLPCANGLLNLPDSELELPTPLFFNLNSLPVRYDPTADDPVAWLNFLEDLWADDPASIDTLQEMSGYFLTPDTRQQKIFAIVGPKRSGKGTIGRVARGLLGADNCCAPSLRSLSGTFGLEPLIGKQVAIVADARLGGQDNQAAVAEALLNISGEDGQTVARKHLSAWSGTLPTRFLILTNELLRIADASGAVAGRCIVLKLTESFYGREDHGLSERLLGELPGILNWSLEGLYRLRKRGHFIQPESARDAVRDLEDLGSPVGAFVRECCNVGPVFEIEIWRLYAAWQEWCKDQGRPATAKTTFGRDLRAVLPHLRNRNLREGDERTRVYVGIGLKP